MRQLRMFLLLAGPLLVNIIHGQSDLQWCANGPTYSIDPNWRTVPNRFEIMTELVTPNNLAELSQAFSTNRDSIAFATKGAGPLQLYWNFATNETFTVETVVVSQQPIQQCLRQVIDATSQTSVLLPNTLFIKPSVLLGYNQRNENNPIWGIMFIQDTMLRNIPAKIFASCFYVSDIGATVSATYWVSDVTKFQAYLNLNQSLVLRIEVQVRTDSGKSESFSYNVFRFTPNPDRREERQALETPSGVYCPNRISTLEFPSDIPDRISSNSEMMLPSANLSIISTHGLYDTEFQFSRFDLWFPSPSDPLQWLHYTEIHDFATGISYRYDHSTRKCDAKPINSSFGDTTPGSENPNSVQMASLQHLLLLDDATYQYTGIKKCHDRVWCNVWMAEKQLSNDTFQHREWYWSTPESEGMRQPTPMKLIVRTYVNAVLVNAFETNIFNFRRRPRTIMEIDFTLADCYRALGPAENFNIAVLSFTVGNEKNYPVMQNLNYLRLHIFEVLTFTLFVRPTRISNLVVDQVNTDIIVTFTLLDAPPFTGSVENPLKELSIDAIVDRLDTAINNNNLIFRARYGTNQVSLRARNGTFNVVHQSSKVEYTSSGGTITGLWIGFIVVGIVIGAGGGYMVMRKRV